MLNENKNNSEIDKRIESAASGILWIFNKSKEKFSENPLQGSVWILGIIVSFGLAIVTILSIPVGAWYVIIRTAVTILPAVGLWKLRSMINPITTLGVFLALICTMVLAVFDVMLINNFWIHAWTNSPHPQVIALNSIIVAEEIILCFYYGRIIFSHCAFYSKCLVAIILFLQFLRRSLYVMGIATEGKSVDEKELDDDYNFTSMKETLLPDKHPFYKERK